MAGTLSEPSAPAAGPPPSESPIDRALVWGIAVVMTGIACVQVALTRSGSGGGAAVEAGRFVNIAFLAAGAAALTIAVRRVRLRTELSDAFFWLVLLNPLIDTRHAGPFDRRLMAAGILGLMAGGIIAMNQNNTLRYAAVIGLALSLGLISTSFLILLLPLVVWALGAGWMLVKSAVPAERVKGFVVMGCGEAGLFAFGLACVLVKPTKSPPAHELFGTIIHFAEFPLLVLAIAMLALGWRKGPKQEGATPAMPPHFAGVLALLVGLLAMLLNNFQLESLPPPGTDQTVLILCLVYTVFALHGPRALRWAAPSVLLVLAALYAVFR